MALSWMKWCCDPLRAEKVRLGVRADDTDFIMSSTPWTIASGGVVMTAATNGSAMVVQMGNGGYPEAPPSISKRVLGAFVSQPSGKIADASTFREWCGPSWRRPLPCPDCRGKWAESCSSCLGQGLYTKVCRHCHHSHNCRCSSCGGGGVLYCKSCVGEETLSHDPGVIHGAAFDRRLIARYLPATSGGRAMISMVGVGEGLRLVVTEVDHIWQMTVPPMILPSGYGDLPRWSS